MQGSARIHELRTKFEENPRRYFAPLANEYRKAGLVHDAIALCREQLAAFPDHMSGHIVLGQSLYETRALDEANAVFSTALALDGENLIALRHLGDIARERGESDVARSWYRRVLEADPQQEDVAAQLASLDGRRHDESAAPAPRHVMDVPGAFATALDAAFESQASDGARPDEGTADEVRQSPELAGWDVESLEPPSRSPDELIFTDREPVEPPSGGSMGVDRPEAGWLTTDFEFSPVVGLDAPAEALVEDPLLVHETAVRDDLGIDVDVGALPLASPYLDMVEGAAEEGAPAPQDPDTPAARDAEGVATDWALDGPLLDADGHDLTFDEIALDELSVPQSADPAPAAPAAPTEAASPPPAATGDDAPRASDAPAALRPAFVTATMAELYVQQGFVPQAIAVYRELAAQRPDDATIAARLAALEAPAATPAAVPAEADHREAEAAATVAHEPPTDEPAERAGDFFAALAARRSPTPAASHAADLGVAASAISSTPIGVEAVDDAAPARPTPVSADAVFAAATVDENVGVSGVAHVAEVEERDPPAPVPLALESLFAGAEPSAADADAAARLSAAFGSVDEGAPRLFDAIAAAAPAVAAPEAEGASAPEPAVANATPAASPTVPSTPPAQPSRATPPAFPPLPAVDVPARPAAPASGAFSFDKFFAPEPAATPAASAPTPSAAETAPRAAEAARPVAPEPAAAPEDDVAQFNDWLRSLRDS